MWVLVEQQKKKHRLGDTRQAWHFLLLLEKAIYHATFLERQWPPTQGLHTAQTIDKSRPGCCLQQLVMPRLISDEGRHTHPLVWAVAIVCLILVIAVIITGIVVLTVYIIYKPTAPYIKVTDAHLNNLVYDQSGLLEIEMALRLVAENNNVRAHASFSDQRILLQFHDIDVAELRADPFEVAKNNSLELNYHFQSQTIPLGDGAMDTMDVALKRGIVPFELIGQARTRWKVGFFPSVRFFTRLSCHLNFFLSNGSAINSACSSKTN